MSLSMQTNVVPINDANRLGLDYAAEAAQLPWQQPIYDAHVHLRDIEAAHLFFKVADRYRIDRIWSMTKLENVADITAEYGERVRFIAVPNFTERDQQDTFREDWLYRIEQFAKIGCKICKIWAAPRGLDLTTDLQLQSPWSQKAIKLAKQAGMMFMTHVADPDTWFQTHYADASKYGHKSEHHQRLEIFLDQLEGTPCIAAHMASHPEDIDHLQQLLDDHPNLFLDTSATKWMVRELSKHAVSDDDQPSPLTRFFQRNAGRILFGSDIVADPQTMTYDLFASRFWTLRTLFETDYRGPSPIVDPDLSMIDPELHEKSTAQLNGACFDSELLQSIYQGTAEKLLLPLYD